MATVKAASINSKNTSMVLQDKTKMYTKTTKEILEPVVEAVAQLIMLDTEELAPMPDLTSSGTVLQKQAQNLAALGGTLANDMVPRLQALVPGICETIHRGGEEIAEATFALKKNPLCRPSRQKLFNGAQTMLKGTAELMNIYDDNEIEKIKMTCQDLKQNVDDIVLLTEVKPIVAVLNKMCEQFVDLARLARSRIDELINQFSVLRLQQALEMLSQSSKLLISSSKAVAASPNDENALETRQHCCQMVVISLSEIEEVVSTDGEDVEAESLSLNTLGGLLTQTKSAATFIQRVDNDHVNKDNLKQLFSVSDRLIQEISVLSNSIKIPEQTQELVQQLRQAISTPYKPANLEMIQNIVCEVESSLISTCLSKTQQAVVCCETDLKEISAAVQSKSTTDKAIEALNESAENLSKTLNALCFIMLDGKAARRVRTLKAQIDSMTAQVVPIVSCLSSNNEKNYSMAHFNTLCTICTEAFGEIRELIRNPDKNAFSMEDISRASEDALQTGVQCLRQSNSDSSKKVAAVIVAEVLNQQAKELQQIESTGDDQEVGEIVAKQIAIIKDVTQKLSSGDTEEALSQIDNNGSLFSSRNIQKKELINEEMNEPVEEAVQLNEVEPAKSVVPNVQEQMQEYCENSTSEEFTQKADEGEELVLMSAEEREQNPIQAANQDFNIALKQWDANTANRMMQQAIKLSKLMAQIAKFYKNAAQESKRELIQAARDIVVEALPIVDEAKKITALCGDVILKNNLMQAAERIPTLATQMKILVAVKTSMPDDLDAEKQLVTCARNLMDAVKVTLMHSESSSLKINKAENVSIVRFKRNALLKKTSSMDLEKMMEKARLRSDGK